MYKRNNYRTSNSYARKRKYPYTSSYRGSAKRTAYNPYAPRTLTANSLKQYNVFESKHHFHLNHVGDAHMTHAGLTGNTGPEYYGIKSLVKITQGAAYYQRIGAKITVTQINLLIQPIWHGIRAGACAVHLVLDRQSNGTVPAYPDIFHQTDTDIASVQNFRNPTNNQRFRFIKSWYFGNSCAPLAICLEDQNGANTGPGVARIVNANPGDNTVKTANGTNTTKHVSIKGRWDIFYADDSGDVGSIKSNNLLLVVQTDNGHKFEQSLRAAAELVFWMHK